MEWQAFFELEPWGCEVENWRMGQIASTMVNVTPRTRGAKAYKPTDFYNQPDQPRSEGFTPQQREFLKRRKKTRGKRGNRRN